MESQLQQHIYSKNQMNTSKEFRFILLSRIDPCREAGFSAPPAELCFPAVCISAWGRTLILFGDFHAKLASPLLKFSSMSSSSGIYWFDDMP